jgi:hypothetical protein
MPRINAMARLCAIALLVIVAESCSSDATRTPTSGAVVGDGVRMDLSSLSSSNFQQCANGKDGGLPCSWINGVLNDSKSDYREGDVIAQRMVISGLTVGHTYRLAFDWGWEKAINPGHMNYDFLAGWNTTLGALAVVCRDLPSNNDYLGVCNTNATVLASHLGADSISAVIPDAVFTTNAPLGLTAELQAAIDRFQTIRGADAVRMTVLGGSFPGNAFENAAYSVSGDNVTGRFTVRFVARRATTREEIDAAVEEAANGALKGVLGINTQPLVSIDFNHNPLSSIYDATQTRVMGDTLVKVLAWYDNEWGFSNRMLDMTLAFAAAR